MKYSTTWDEFIEISESESKGKRLSNDNDDYVFYYDGDDEDLMYQSLLSQCSESERRLIEEVAGGDYWLAQSILHDLSKD